MYCFWSFKTSWTFLYETDIFTLLCFFYSCNNCDYNDNLPYSIGFQVIKMSIYMTWEMMLLLLLLLFTLCYLSCYNLPTNVKLYIDIVANVYHLYMIMGWFIFSIATWHLTFCWLLYFFGKLQVTRISHLPYDVVYFLLSRICIDALWFCRGLL